MLLRYSALWRFVGAVLVLMLLALIPLAADDSASDDAAGSDAEKTEKAEKAIPYPVEICLVAEEKLGSMGEPVVFVHDGYEIKFCCAGCQGAFDRDTAGHMAKLKGWHKAAAEKSDEEADEKADDDAGDHQHE